MNTRLKTPPTLSELDSWFSALGIEPKNDRIHLLYRTLDDMGAATGMIGWHGRKVPRGEVDDNELLNVVMEVRELHDIYHAFKDERSDALREKLKIALSGPLSLLTETVENSQSRNAFFELALAASWRRLGLDIEIGDPDIIASIDGLTFYVECKRPFREHSVRSNLRGAADQLRIKLERTNADKAYGIVALSVSRLYNRGASYVHVIEKAKLNRVDSLLNDFWHNHERHLKGHEIHPRTVAVLLHLSFPLIVNKGEQMKFSVVQCLAPVGSHPTFDFLEQRLKSLLVRSNLYTSW